MYGAYGDYYDEDHPSQAQRERKRKRMRMERLSRELEHSKERRQARRLRERDKLVGPYGYGVEQR